MTARPVGPGHLRLENASFAAGNGTVLVDGVGFEVARGQITAVAGPNGAGKTMLIRMIVGLATPGAGTITLGGRSLPAMSFAERARHVAHVGQSDEPDGRLSVRDYVALGALPLAREHRGDAPMPGGDAPMPGGPGDDAEAIIARVGLGTFAHVRLDRLSGGERQKAKIARAMCQRPDLLVLDEPTNHLDPRARGELLSLVAGMGITVVVALHDLTLIETFADKVAVMEGGRLRAFGPPVEVLSAARVRAIFGVALHRFPHPGERRLVPALDIEIARPA